MKKHHVDILISEADVRSRINELGAEITHFYQQQAIDKLIVVGLLRGSFMFMADLVRELKLPVEVEFMTTSSYGAGNDKQSRCENYERSRGRYSQ